MNSDLRELLLRKMLFFVMPGCSSFCPTQLASWVDAVILVFSLENESSFHEVYKIYHQLAAHRPVSEIAFVVVGTQGETEAEQPCANLNPECAWKAVERFRYFFAFSPHDRQDQQHQPQSHR